MSETGVQGQLIERLRARSKTDRPDRRSQILDVAAELFGAAGFSVSVADIARANGILPGSLYHHFASKEAIVIALIERYQADLDQVAAATHADASATAEHRVIALARAITACAVQHRAAVLQTLYEPPATASAELIELAHRSPKAISAAMAAAVKDAHAAGLVGSKVDLALLSDQLCQSMLHTAVGSFETDSAPDLMAEIKCRILLRGLATGEPADSDLDKSAAFAAAEAAIASWARDENSDTASLVHNASRREFGRRGFEATTMRDIALAAGVSVGSLYNVAESKVDLLATVMASYIGHVTNAWDAVATSDSTATEKLDALLWIDINVLDRFSDEFKIQLAWLRDTPPPTLDSLDSFTNMPRHMREILLAGEESGEFHTFDGAFGLRLNAMLELVWLSENLVRNAGAGKALEFARSTLIRGAGATR